MNTSSFFCARLLAAIVCMAGCNGQPNQNETPVFLKDTASIATREFTEVDSSTLDARVGFQDTQARKSLQQLQREKESRHKHEERMKWKGHQLDSMLVGKVTLPPRTVKDSLRTVAQDTPTKSQRELQREKELQIKLEHRRRHPYPEMDPRWIDNIPNAPDTSGGKHDNGGNPDLEK